MNYSTGPPDPQDVVARLALIGLLYLSVLPFAYVADELNASNPAMYSTHSK